jgi:hypothetical protein
MNNSNSSSCFVGVSLTGLVGCFVFVGLSCPMHVRVQPTINTIMSIGDSRAIVSLLCFFLLVGFVVSGACYLL